MGKKIAEKWQRLKSFYIIVLSQQFPAPSEKVTGICTFSGQGSRTS